MRHRPHLQILAGALLVATVALAGAQARAADPPSEETISYFKTNCTSCHTIGGGKLAGPDLKNVVQRRTREQLTKFVADPKGAIDSGDAYLAKLLQDANGVYMPTPPGIDTARIGKLLDLIEAESALEKSQFAGGTLSERPLTQADIDRGAAIFEGSRPLKNGAPACFSCHMVDGLGAMGGGRLGLDLTDVYGRLGGRKPLGAWLTSPQSPTMAPVFRGKALDEAEILGLVAYLQSRAEASGGRKQSGPGAGMFEFLAAGVAGLVLALGAFDYLWRGRFRSVRRAMVEGSRR